MIYSVPSCCRGGVWVWTTPRHIRYFKNCCYCCYVLHVTLIMIVGEISWPINSRNSLPFTVRTLDKNHAIKLLVVCWMLLNLILYSWLKSIASYYKQIKPFGFSSWLLDLNDLAILMSKKKLCFYQSIWLCYSLIISSLLPSFSVTQAFFTFIFTY